ncbi:YbaK/EbsC family protein [Actinomycetospora corticicola]|uniref:Prolyl-tRNA editing enzyme YbaK/EbsC (Cys-tRNA(Pro) deacylase) n=1 Tax=Actinomycetospora corticicola TaxID=663602 RepID=A0A7Y9DYQ2_9PSEU|nr:YbaK/EbsC family protein [Actinomycetospora corticicola]NYD37916.1 prolyl-tRNA editing enzyme YbaK/EbsC (Cys-tRNA(Pro) deacylase) [Actinomycetospora corticicola]
MVTDLQAAAGTLELVPAPDRPDLLAAPVAAALDALPVDVARSCGVAVIDPGLADTAAFCEAYSSPLELSANCVVVTGARSGEQRFAGCVVLATTRADVNGVVRRRIDVRKASFAAMDLAVELTGMECGGITPFGLPAGWPVLVDPAVLAAPAVVVGSGLRASKLVVPGSVLGQLPGAEPTEGLGR